MKTQYMYIWVYSNKTQTEIYLLVKRELLMIQYWHEQPWKFSQVSRLPRLPLVLLAEMNNKRTGKEEMRFVGFHSLCDKAEYKGEGCLEFRDSKLKVHTHTHCVSCAFAQETHIILWKINHSIA